MYWLRCSNAYERVYGVGYMCPEGHAFGVDQVMHPVGCFIELFTSIVSCSTLALCTLLWTKVNTYLKFGHCSGSAFLAIARMIHLLSPNSLSVVITARQLMIVTGDRKIGSEIILASSGMPTGNAKVDQMVTVLMLYNDENMYAFLNSRNWFWSLGFFRSQVDFSRYWESSLVVHRQELITELGELRNTNKSISGQTIFWVHLNPN